MRGRDVGMAAIAALALACAETRPAARSGGAASGAGASAAAGPDEVKRQAAEALSRNAFADAERLYAEAGRLAPGDPGALVGLARVHLAAGRAEDALAAADRAVALGERPDALAVRGGALARLRRFDGAARDLDRASALGLADGDAWVTWAVVELNRGDDVEAAHAFGGAVTALGRNPAVEAIWPALVGLAPDPQQPQEALDRCHRGAVALLDGRLDEARHEALNGMRYSPRFSWCAANLGETERRAGDLGRAELLLRRAIDAYPAHLEPLRADAKARLAAVLLDAARPAEAIPLSREALATRPDRAATLDVLARACDAAADAPCAREAYARLLGRPHLPVEVRARAEARLAALAGGAAPSAAR